MDDCKSPLHERLFYGWPRHLAWRHIFNKSCATCLMLKSYAESFATREKHSLLQKSVDAHLDELNLSWRFNSEQVVCFRFSTCQRQK